MRNKNLHSAKKEKNDEFYTQYSDIEKELYHYKEHFKGKAVYLNCDTKESNFYKFFKDIGDEWGIKELMRSSIAEGVDFRSGDSVDMLKRADIIVTNPPFSLFREYIAQLVEYNKRFLIIGNMNAVICKEIFPLIKDNKMWYGQSISSGDREFRVPDHYPLHSAGFRVDEDGVKYIRVKGVRWFTNLDHGRRREPMQLMTMEDNKRYSKHKKNPKWLNSYLKYDNYDAIEIPFSDSIPSDYSGAMGVPISFLDKYNSDQFEIIGSLSCPRFKSTNFYARIIIKHKKLSTEKIPASSL